MQQTIIRILSQEELLSIYAEHSVRHFPKAELKPESAIRRMAEEGIYQGYGLFRLENTEETLICYAFFVVPPGISSVLLDYFAVLEQYRSLGAGSLFLRHMKDSGAFQGILLEVEDPDYSADETERTLRQKRIAFYDRNGACFTGIRAEVFGVRYRVLYLPILSSPDRETLLSDFSSIYRHMVSPKSYEKHIRIQIP